MTFAATEELARSLAQSPTGSTAAAKAALMRLCREIGSRAGREHIESHDFFLSASEALERMRGAQNAALRLPALAACANYFQVCGFAQDALKTAGALRDLASYSHETVWLRKSYALIGMVQAEVGDVGGALVNYEKSLELARSESRSAEVAALVNIGTALNYCSLYQEAVPCFQRASAVARVAMCEPEARTYAAVALGNLAQSYLFLGEHVRGYESICIATSGMPDPTDLRSAFSRTVREWTHVQLALELGEIDDARSHSELCWRFGTWGANPRALILARISKGLCEVFGGDVADGLDFLQSTLSMAADEAQSEDVLRAQLRAYDEAEQEDKALDLLARLRLLLRRRFERGILTALSLSNTGLNVSAADPVFRIAPLDLRESRLQTRLAEKKAIASQLEILERFAVAADLREDVSGEHGYRVGRLSRLLAAAINVPDDKSDALEMAARLHDIGKLGIPERVLTSRERLRGGERELMNAHTNIGAELLSKSQLPQLRMAEQIALCHHEWWNGNGYPSGLKGDKIPLAARIVAVADVFDALTHGRPYAPAWTISLALEEIRRLAGTQFDPHLVGPFANIVEELQTEFGDLDTPLGVGAKSSAFLRSRRNIRGLISPASNQN